MTFLPNLSTAFEHITRALFAALMLAALSATIIAALPFVIALWLPLAIYRDLSGA